jgi:SOS-response transcriptional repressor LexA
MHLTRQQKELYDWICAYIAENEIAPSFDEMATAMGLNSKSGIHRLLCALEERGFIARMPARARCIEILRDGQSRLDGAEELTVTQRKLEQRVAWLQDQLSDYITFVERNGLRPAFSRFMQEKRA